MKKTFLFFVLLISNLTLAQGPPPPPCWFFNILEGCDETNQDGFAVFNLQEANEQLFCDLDPIDYNFPLYFENNEDALSNSNAIENYKSYRNTISEQRIYSRLVGVTSEIPTEIRYFYLLSENCLSITTSDKIQFLIFPNPATHIVNFKLNGNVGNSVSISIYDLQGKLILEDHYNMDSNTVQFDVSPLTSGLYFIKMNTDEFQTVEKLVIK